MNLRNPSTEGDDLTPGQEPVIADGVRGVWFDMPDGIWMPLVVAERPGSGDVGRMLDSLPRDRRVVVPGVIKHKLEGMLRRRGFAERPEEEAWIRESAASVEPKDEK